eukprot:Clim_evm21s229 gene=Clim_evmTU21s229
MTGEKGLSSDAAWYERGREVFESPGKIPKSHREIFRSGIPHRQRLAAYFGLLGLPRPEKGWNPTEIKHDGQIRYDRSNHDYTSKAEELYLDDEDEPIDPRTFEAPGLGFMRSQMQKLGANDGSSGLRFKRVISLLSHYGGEPTPPTHAPVLVLFAALLLDESHGDGCSVTEGREDLTYMLCHALYALHGRRRKPPHGGEFPPSTPNNGHALVLSGTRRLYGYVYTIMHELVPDLERLIMDGLASEGNSAGRVSSKDNTKSDGIPNRVLAARVALKHCWSMWQTLRTETKLRLCDIYLAERDKGLAKGMMAILSAVAVRWQQKTGSEKVIMAHAGSPDVNVLILKMLEAFHHSTKFCCRLLSDSRNLVPRRLSVILDQQESQPTVALPVDLTDSQRLAQINGNLPGSQMSILVNPSSIMDRVGSSFVLANDHDNSKHSSERAYGHFEVPSYIAPPSWSSEFPKSELLSPSAIRILWAAIPKRFHMRRLARVYATRDHGYALTSLYNKCYGYAPCFLVIRDSDGCVFGAFLTEDFGKVLQNPRRFIGSGESFVYTVRETRQKTLSSVRKDDNPDAADAVQSHHHPALFPKERLKMRIFPWIGINAGVNSRQVESCFLTGDAHYLAIGGVGTSGAIYLDEALNHGSTGLSLTFGSPPLTTALEDQSDDVTRDGETTETWVAHTKSTRGNTPAATPKSFNCTHIEVLTALP